MLKARMRYVSAMLSSVETIVVRVIVLALLLLGASRLILEKLR